MVSPTSSRRGYLEINREPRFSGSAQDSFPVCRDVRGIVPPAAVFAELAAAAGSELEAPLVITIHLFRCPAHGVNDLIVRLAVIQLRLQEQSPGVEFLGCSHIGLGTEGLSPREL